MIILIIITGIMACLNLQSSVSPKATCINNVLSLLVSLYAEWT